MRFCPTCSLMGVGSCSSESRLTEPKADARTGRHGLVKIVPKAPFRETTVPAWLEIDMRVAARIVTRRCACRRQQ
jgi:hypothetical protein